MECVKNATSWVTRKEPVEMSTLFTAVSRSCSGFFWVALTLFLFSTHTHAHDWAVTYDNSSLGFSGFQSGVLFKGYFERFTADIFFDPNNLKESQVEVVVDMTSARTGDPVRDTALQQDTWLYTAEYPYAYFVSEEFRQLSKNQYVTSAVLTIRGQSRDVLLPFDLTLTRDHAKVLGELTITRTDFHVGQGFWSSGQIVSLPITITVHLEAVRE